MSSTATQAKKRWNDAHYTQVKVSVTPELAVAFKSACMATNVPMAGKLGQFMAEYSNTPITRKPKPDYSTRRQRRAAIHSIMQQLEKIKDAEEYYRDNIPENLRGSAVFDLADQSVSLMDEAIVLLDEIY